MSYFLIQYITAWGLGRLLPMPRGSSFAGLRFCLGSLLVPLLLFIGNVGLGIGLSKASRILFLLSAVALGIEWFRGFVYWRISRPASRKSSDAMAFTRVTRLLQAPLQHCLHPVVLLPLVYLTAQHFMVHEGYTPHQWDEFSHWALMPKQILLFDKVTSSNFPYQRFLEYTPGWPLILDYPLFVLGRRFATDSLLYAPFMISLGLAALLYDVVKHSLAVFVRTGQHLTEHHRSALSWIALLCFAGLNSGIQLTPVHILIEPPLEAVACSIFLIVLLAEVDAPLRSRSRWSQTATGIVLAAGYLLKKPFLFAVAAGVPMVWFSWRDSLTERPLLRRFLRFGISIALIFSPLLVCLVSWESITSQYPRIFVVSGERVHLPLVQILVGWEFLSILADVCRWCAYILKHHFALTLVAFLGLWCGIRSRRSFQTSFSLMVATSLYFLILCWLYRTTFPDEGMRLASFGRYAMTIFKVDLVFYGVIAFLEMSPRLHSLPPLRTVCFSIALPLLALCLAVQGFKAFRFLGTENQLSPVLQEAPALIRALEQHKLRGKQILLLYDGQAAIVYYQAIYASIDRAGPAAFSTSGANWYLPIESRTKGDRWSVSISDGEFRTLLDQSEILWPIQASSWAARIMQEKFDPVACPGAVEQYFFFKNSTSGTSFPFTCVNKR